MRKWKNVYGVLIAVMLLAAQIGIPVFAKEADFSLEESEKIGSITIQLEDTAKNLSRENVCMTVVQIADMVNGQFVMCDAFADTNIDLNQIHNANELEDAAIKLKRIASDGKSIITNRNGVAAISDLTAGVYLVYASDIAGYEEITPALVSIPVWDEIKNEMVYDIEMLPKHTPLTEEVPDIPKTGVQDQSFTYLMTAAGAFIIAGICFAVTYKEKDRTLQKK